MIRAVSPDTAAPLPPAVVRTNQRWIYRVLCSVETGISEVELVRFLIECDTNQQQNNICLA